MLLAVEDVVEVWVWGPSLKNQVTCITRWAGHLICDISMEEK